MCKNKYFFKKRKFFDTHIIKSITFAVSKNTQKIEIKNEYKIYKFNLKKL